MNVKTISNCYFIEDEQPSLEWIQKTLGGYMEVVHLADKRQLLVNDNSAINGMEFNPLATNINLQVGTSEALYGNAIILSENALLD